MSQHLSPGRSLVVCQQVSTTIMVYCEQCHYFLPPNCALFKHCAGVPPYFYGFCSRKSFTPSSPPFYRLYGFSTPCHRLSLHFYTPQYGFIIYSILPYTCTFLSLLFHTIFNVITCGAFFVSNVIDFNPLMLMLMLCNVSV